MNSYIQNIKLREIKTRARQDVIKSVNVPSCSWQANVLSHKHDKHKLETASDLINVVIEKRVRMRRHWNSHCFKPSSH